jgi:hypothetical protein
LLLTAPPSLSITRRLKIKVAVFSLCNRGALNVGVAVLEPNSVTGNPVLLGTCVHKYATTVPPSGSWLVLPSNVTALPSVTVWEIPTLAIGG